VYFDAYLSQQGVADASSVSQTGPNSVSRLTELYLPSLLSPSYVRFPQDFNSMFAVVDIKRLSS
jgi:hypothetical protein